MKYWKKLLDKLTLRDRVQISMSKKRKSLTNFVGPLPLKGNLKNNVSRGLTRGPVAGPGGGGGGGGGVCL